MPRPAWVGSRSPVVWDQMGWWLGLHQPPLSFWFDSQTRGTRENRAPPCVKVPGSSRVPPREQLCNRYYSNAHAHSLFLLCATDIFGERRVEFRFHDGCSPKWKSACVVRINRWSFPWTRLRTVRALRPASRSIRSSARGPSSPPPSPLLPHSPLPPPLAFRPALDSPEVRAGGVGGGGMG